MLMRILYHTCVVPENRHTADRAPKHLRAVPVPVTCRISHGADYHPCMKPRGATITSYLVILLHDRRVAELDQTVGQGTGTCKLAQIN